MTIDHFAATAAPRRAPALITLLAVLCLLALTPAGLHAQAVDQTWINTNPNNDWSLTAPNWNGAVPWTNGNNAIFAGTGETVEIASDVTVNNITFNSSGYTIADANGDSIFSLSTGSIITVTTAGHIATISESIAAGGITKGGAGILVLSGDNTFGDTVSVTAGILRLSSNTALGSPAASTMVSGSGSTAGIIELQNGVTITGETVIVASGGGDNNGGLRAGVSASATWAGSILLDGGNRLGALNAGLLNVTGVISNGATGGLQISTTGSSTATLGTVRISTPATYTGNTSIIRGRLQLGVDGALPTTTIVDVDTATAAEDSIFDLNGHIQTIAGLSRSNSGGTGGGSFVTNSSAAAATLTISNSGNQTYAGIIQDGTGLLSIVKTGTATQTLSGDNTYTGTTTVSAGTLALSGTNALPGAVTVSGGILSFTGGTHSLGALEVTSGTLSSTAPTAATFASLNYASSGSSTLAGATTITGATTISAGTLALNGANVLTGNVSITGGVTTFGGATTFGGNIAIANATVTLSAANAISSGATLQLTGSTILNVNNNGALGSLNALTISSGARLTLGNGVTITGKTATVAGTGGANSAGPIQSESNATATWAGNIILSAAARLSGGSNGTLNVNGVISGSAGVLYSRNVNATTVLNGINTYTGDTQMYSGSVGSTSRLVIGVDNALTVSRLSVISTAAISNMVVDLNGHTIAFAGIDTSDNHLSGPFLSIVNNGAAATALTLASNTGTVQVFNGRINDGTSALSLVKNGSYVQALVNANGYTGTTTINAGTLQIGRDTGAATYTGSNGSLASTTLILNSSTTGQGASDSTNTGTLAINNAGTINNATNRLADNAELSFRGGTFSYIGSDQAATSSTETIGAITAHSKRSLLTMTYGAGNAATLTASSFSRLTNGGLLFVNGTNLGLNSLATANVSRILFTTAPDLVGTTAAASTGLGTIKNLQIVPGMLGEATATTGGTGTATGTPNTFLTYNPTTGLRPLNPTDEFSASFTPGDNVRLTAATSLAPSILSINSLIVVSSGSPVLTETIGAGKTLTVTSGQILFTGGTGGITLGGGGTLAFGNREGIITTFAGGNTNITAVITGTAGVSYYGTGTLVTNQQHTYSGATGLYLGVAIPQSSSAGAPGAPTSGPFGTGLLILGGASLRATSANAVIVHNNIELRSDTTMITGSANDTSTFTFTGAVSLTAGTRTITNSSQSNTYFSGAISETTAGSGLTIAGNSVRAVVLGGTNTYTGATTVTGATTLVINGNQSAATGPVNINAGTLGGTGTLGGVTTIASGATLSPGDVSIANVSANGTLSSISSLTLKSGSNTALQITTATFTSTDSFGGNQPGTLGYNNYVIANGNTAGSAGTAHDKLIFTSVTQEAAAKITVSGVAFTPAAGQIFNLIDWTDLVGTSFAGNLGPTTRTGAEDNTGSGFDLDLPDISASGFAWDTSLFATHGIIVVTPEPTRALLLGMGFALLGLRRRRAK